MLDLSDRADLAWLSLVLGEAQTAAPTASFLLVGAMARDLWLSYAHGVRIERATTDVDCAIAVATWEEFASIKGELLRSGRFEARGPMQRLRHVSGRTVDLVPFGGIEDPHSRIAWPPAGDTAMNVMGCREAKAASETLALPDRTTTSIVSLPGLLILKFFAFADRALTEPRKDASDLWVILSNYLEAGNATRLYEAHADLLETDPFDLPVAGAAMAGRDVRQLIVDHSQSPQVVRDALSALLDKELDLKGQARLLGQVSLDRADAFREMLLAFRRELLGT